MANTDVKLPDLGEGVTEGELIKWLVKPGDSVKADQALVEMMTDKATVEVPTPIAGKVLELKAKEGSVVKLGETLVILETGGVAAAATKAAAPATQSTPSAKPTAPTGSSPAQKPQSPSSPALSLTADHGTMAIHPPVADSRVLATPSTRRLAREMGVDINGIEGTGIAGRVTREDLSKGGTASAPGAGAMAAGAPSFQIPRLAYQSGAGAVEERVALKGVRKKIAEKMQMSKHIVPHFTLMDEANVSELVQWRSQLKETAAKMGVKVTYLPFVMKALIATIREYPMFNASIDDAAAEIVYKKYFNIGFAADTPQGLLVPVVKDADRKTILQISKDITELSEKGRAGKLSLEEMKGATISITNIGSIGGTYATPIINHPEVAILGMYKIQEKPIFVGDVVKKAYVMNVTITADHRLIDGAVAANFLKAFVQRLESPSHLMLDMI